MKFEKPQSASAVDADTVALANRYEERRTREKAERFAPAPNPYVRAKIARLFQELSDSIGPGPTGKQRHHLVRPADLREKQASQAAAMENLESLQDRYAENPLTISDELRAKSHQMTRETAPDEEASI